MERKEIIEGIKALYHKGLTQRYTRDVGPAGHYFAWCIKVYSFNFDRVNRIAKTEYGCLDRFDEKWNEFLVDQDSTGQLFQDVAEGLLGPVVTGDYGPERIAGRYRCAVFGRSGGWLALTRLDDVTVLPGSEMFTDTEDACESISTETLADLLEVLTCLTKYCQHPTRSMEEEYAYQRVGLEIEWREEEKFTKKMEDFELGERWNRDQPVI